MFTIVIGHFLGMIVTMLFLRNVAIISTGPESQFLTYLGLVCLLIFIEYQLVNSLKRGHIYFRGSIDKSDGAKFTQCQLAYSFQAGLFIMIILRNLLA